MKSLEDTNRALENIYRMDECSRSDPAAKQALERELEKENIKTSKNTTTDFTLLIKLFFGKDQPRSTISRLAYTLQLAREENIEPQGFMAFVREKGGTAACARLLTQKRREAKADTAKDPQGAAAQSASERPADAPNIKFPEALGAFSEPYIMLTAKREADGSYTVQHCQGLPARVIDEWARMEATRTGGVVHEHR